jgi:uncharacterized protein with HEPN domain
MFDRDIMVLSTLQEIAESIRLIRWRFVSIHSSDYFLADEEGLIRLDSISMRLIAIVEAFKGIVNHSDKILLNQSPQVKRKEVKGIRNILSHHYFDLDADTIFGVYEEDIPLWEETVGKMMAFWEARS